MEVKITRISRKDTDKDGNPLLSKKDKKPYWKIGIQTEQTGDEWLSGFANNQNDPRYLMQEGGTYHIAIEEKPNPNGGVYKNFRMLKPEEVELEELRKFKAEKEKISTSTETAQAESHITLDDIDPDEGKF